MKILFRFLKRRDEATAIEYGLIASLITMAAIGGASLVTMGAG